MPTLLILDQQNSEGGNWPLAEIEGHVASLMPRATVEPHPLQDRSGVGVREVQEAIRRFMGADRRSDALDSVLATELFTDIFDSPPAAPRWAIASGG